MKNFGKNLALWIVIALLLVAVFNLFESSTKHGVLPPIAYSDFIDEVDKGQIKSVHISGKMLTVVTTDGRSFSTYEPDDPTMVQRLLDKKVLIVSTPDDENTPSLLSILVSWFPLLIIIGVLYFVTRRAQRGATTPLETQIRIDQLEAQVRRLAGQLEEIQSDRPHPPTQLDQMHANS